MTEPDFVPGTAGHGTISFKIKLKYLLQNMKYPGKNLRKCIKHIYLKLYYWKISNSITKMK